MSDRNWIILQNLGVEVIYFNPLFVSPSNHKYDIQDYDYIDPHYGKIVEDGGGLLKDGVSDNRKAERYINRVTNKKNLEASNRFCRAGRRDPCAWHESDLRRCVQSLWII